MQPKSVCSDYALLDRGIFARPSAYRLTSWRSSPQRTERPYHAETAPADPPGKLGLAVSSLADVNRPSSRSSSNRRAASWGRSGRVVRGKLVSSGTHWAASSAVLAGVVLGPDAMKARAPIASAGLARTPLRRCRQSVALLPTTLQVTTPQEASAVSTVTAGSAHSRRKSSANLIGGHPPTLGAGLSRSTCSDWSVWVCSRRSSGHPHFDPHRHGTTPAGVLMPCLPPTGSACGWRPSLRVLWGSRGSCCCPSWDSRSRHGGRWPSSPSGARARRGLYR